MIVPGIGNRGRGHIHDLPAHLHFMRFIAARPEEGTSDRKDSADVLIFQRSEAVFHEAPETVLNPDHLGALPEGCFCNPADGGIQPGAVAPGGENADCFRFCSRH